MDSERLLQLMAKQMGRAASEKEIAELKQLLLVHPEYQYFLEIVQYIESEKRHREPIEEEEELIERGWSLLHHELKEKETGKKSVQKIIHRPEGKGTFIKKYRKINWLWKAAIWAALIGILYGSFLWQRSTEIQHTSVASAALKEVQLAHEMPKEKILPDSSIVWLNAGSRIRYAENFLQQGQRVVYLEGEAYFEVKQDAIHPFIVHAGNIIIHVLGTSFNVQAYEDEELIETTLVNGKVQVQINGKPEKKIVLLPHEKLTVQNENFYLSGKKIRNRKELSFKVQEVSPMKQIDELPEVAWLEDKVAFQGESFREIARKLERRYGVQIIFGDKQLAGEKLTGVFENENIQKAMKILQMTTPFEYKVRNDTVFLNR